ELLRPEPRGCARGWGEGRLAAARFSALAARGRAALGAGEADEALKVPREALALWRGPPLADFTFDSFARDEIARLEELCLGTLEDRIQADLAVGHHDDVVSELQTLVAR